MSGAVGGGAGGNRGSGGGDGGGFGATGGGGSLGSSGGWISGSIVGAGAAGWPQVRYARPAANSSEAASTTRGKEVNRGFVAAGWSAARREGGGGNGAGSAGSAGAVAAMAERAGSEADRTGMRTSKWQAAQRSGRPTARESNTMVARQLGQSIDEVMSWPQRVNRDLRLSHPLYVVKREISLQKSEKRGNRFAVVSSPGGVGPRTCRERPPWRSSGADGTRWVCRERPPWRSSEATGRRRVCRERPPWRSAEATGTPRRAFPTAIPYRRVSDRCRQRYVGANSR
jgi:hypothetical protein